MLVRQFGESMYIQSWTDAGRPHIFPQHGVRCRMPDSTGLPGLDASSYHRAWREHWLGGRQVARRGIACRARCADVPRREECCACLLRTCSKELQSMDGREAGWDGRGRLASEASMTVLLRTSFHYLLRRDTRPATRHALKPAQTHGSLFAGRSTVGIVCPGTTTGQTRQARRESAHHATAAEHTSSPE